MISLPDNLLNCAGIYENADVQIICSKQMVIIFQSTGKLSDELDLIQNKLKAATETMSQPVSQ